MAVQVDSGNFVRAETNRRLAGRLATSPGLNEKSLSRALAPLEQQTMIRMNRATVYSFAIVDISAGRPQRRRLGHRTARW